MTDRAPILLLTRPRAQSEQFLSDCQAHIAGRLNAVISPIIDIVPTGETPNLEQANTIVVTSGHAVRLSGASLQGKRVVTVGEATARLAQELGAKAISGGDTVDDLLSNIALLKPPVLVCRGVHARVDLADALTSRGITATAVTLYDQVAAALSPEARAVLDGKAPVIAPVFSPRSAALLSAVPRSAPFVVLAISKAAGDAWTGDGEVRLAQAPTSRAMRELVAKMV